MSQETTKTETMLHPFNMTPCDVLHLNPGDEVQSSDLYRSVTLAEDGSPMDSTNPRVGRWFLAGDILDGHIIAQDCNVHFIRLLPTLESGLSSEEEEALLLKGLHAVE